MIIVIIIVLLGLLLLGKNKIFYIINIIIIYRLYTITIIIVIIIKFSLWAVTRQSEGQMNKFVAPTWPGLASRCSLARCPLLSLPLARSLSPSPSPLFIPPFTETHPLIVLNLPLIYINNIFTVFGGQTEGIIGKIMRELARGVGGEMQRARGIGAGMYVARRKSREM